MKKKIDLLEGYAIAITGVLTMMISLAMLWIFTQKMIEDVIFISMMVTFFVTGGFSFVLDSMLRNVKKGIRNA